MHCHADADAVDDDRLREGPHLVPTHNTPRVRVVSTVPVPYTGCPGDEAPWSVDVFLTDCMVPTGARPMSRLRRPLLPVTSSSFTAPEVHTRSWRRQAREFEVKPLSSRLKLQPIASGEATLVGKNIFR